MRLKLCLKQILGVGSLGGILRRLRRLEEVRIKNRFRESFSLSRATDIKRGGSNYMGEYFKNATLV